MGSREKGNNGKRKLRRTIWKLLSVIAVILWAAVIFRFSSQQGTKSSGVSGKICYAIATEYSNLSHQDLSEAQIRTIAEGIQFPVRKAAHMSEYALLALLVFNALRALGMAGGKKRYALSLLLVAAYAASDEIHQLFIPGRSGQLWDVLIDTAGGLIMLCLIRLIRRAWLHGKRKPTKEKRVA